MLKGRAPLDMDDELLEGMSFPARCDNVETEIQHRHPGCSVRDRAHVALLTRINTVLRDCAPNHATPKFDPAPDLQPDKPLRSRSERVNLARVHDLISIGPMSQAFGGSSRPAFPPGTRAWAADRR